MLWRVMKRLYTACVDAFRAELFSGLLMIVCGVRSKLCLDLCCIQYIDISLVASLLLLAFFFMSRTRTEALAARVSEAEEAEASAKADLSVANGSVRSLEKALDAAEAEKGEVVRRLTRQGGDYVAVRGGSLGVLFDSTRLVSALFFFLAFGLCAAVVFG